MSVFVDIHVLQTVPYANLNRDFEGSPKSMVYGGTERTRVSSQSWKRAIRHDVEAAIGEKTARTRQLPQRVAEILTARHGWPTELATFAGAQVAESTGKALKTGDDGETSVLLYLPDSAGAALAELCDEHREALEAEVAKPKNKRSAVLPSERVVALIRGKAATINLFGRMLAEIPGSNVDGAVQIAHAFTTHESDSQSDFFTAVDDWLNFDKDTGAGHMNIGEFSAGVFYRYATVNVDDLVTNLDGDSERARELVELFLTHFIMSMPQAKKNSTAPHTVPDLVHIVVRDGRPVSAAAAFEKPVLRAHEGGITEPSIAELNTYIGRLDQLIGTRAKRFAGHAGFTDKPCDALGEQLGSFADLTAAATAAAFEPARVDA